MKKNKKKILITDIPSEKIVEKKVFGKNFNIYLTNYSSFKSLSKSFKSKIDGILAGHQIKFNKKVIDEFKNCKAITRYGIGYDNIDVDYAKKKGIKVFVVPDYGVDEVSDHALSLILSLNRSTIIYDKEMRNLKNGSKIKWDHKTNLNQKRFKNMKIGIVGLGRIGSSLARKSRALGMDVFFYDPFINDGYDKVMDIKKVDEIYDLARICDIISLHIPYSKKNHNFINENFFKKIKKKIIFINVSRGGLVSSKVLAKYYGSKISRIGLDVFDEEPPSLKDPLIKLWTKKQNQGKIILSPHSAFYSYDSVIELRSKASKTLKNFITKKILSNCVNK